MEKSETKQSQSQVLEKSDFLETVDKTVSSIRIEGSYGQYLYTGVMADRMLPTRSLKMILKEPIPSRGKYMLNPLYYSFVVTQTV